MLKDNIRKLRMGAGMGQKEFAEAIGTTVRTVSAWETGSRRPHLGSLRAIADLFQIKPSDLKDKDFLELSPVYPGHRAVMTQTRPLYATIAAGTPREQWEEEGEIPVPDEVLRDHPIGHFLRVSGHSVNKYAPDGFLVYIDTDMSKPVKRGQMMAISINGHEAVLRRIFQTEAGIRLSPDSWDPSYEDQYFDNDDDHNMVEIIGQSVWVTSAYAKKGAGSRG